MKDLMIVKRYVMRSAGVATVIAAGVAVMVLLSPVSKNLPMASQSAAAQGGFKCSTAILAGSYAVRGDGVVPGGPPPAPMIPFGLTSRMTLDGAGGLSDDVTVSRNGQILRGVNPGTYSVGEDCKGTMSIDINEPPFRLNFDLVVYENGKGFYFIGTTPAVVTHEAKRIHPGI